MITMEQTFAMDAAGENMTMKQKEDQTFHDLKSFEKEIDPLSFGSEEKYELSKPGVDNNLAAFDAKGREACWNDEVRGGFSLDNADANLVFSGKEDQNGLINHQSGREKDADSLSSANYDKEKIKESLAHKTFGRDENFIYCNRDESRNFSSPCDGNASETDSNLCTLRYVLKSELPELEVFEKKINHQVVKDICIDEGIQKEKNLIESLNDGTLGAQLTELLVHQDHYEGKEALPLEKANNFITDPCGTTVENDLYVAGEIKLRSSTDSFFNKDTDKHYDPENSEQSGEANCGRPGRSSSEADTLVDRMIPIHKFEKQNSVGSIIFSLDGEEKMPMPPDQIPYEEVVFEVLAASPSEAGELRKDFQAAGLSYSSNVENGSITFNFNSSAPVDVDMEDGVEAKNNNRQPIDSAETSSHSTVYSDKVQCTSSVDTDDHEQSHSSNLKNFRDQMPQPKDGDTDDRSSEGEAQFSIIRNQSCTPDIAQAVDPNKPKHEPTNSGNASFPSHLLHEGEMSFSAVNFVTYSGPIPNSGSLSHRSDASTTSGRSFAFPVLQTEWNYSPVRMAKADRRHFRKHKGWRSGLFCCRF